MYSKIVNISAVIQFFPTINNFEEFRISLNNYVKDNFILVLINTSDN